MKKKSEKVKPKAFAQKAKRVARRPAAAGKKKDSSHAPSLARPTAVRPANPSKNALAKKPAGPARPVKALQTAAAAKTKPAAKATSPKRASAPKRPAKTTAAVKTPKPAKAKKPVQAQTAPTPSSPGRTPESAKKPKSASTPRSAERARPVKTSREKAAETPEPQTQPEASAGVAIPSVDVDAPPAAEPQPEPKRRTAVKTARKPSKKDDDDKALVKFDPLQRYLSEISRYRLLTRDEERSRGARVMEQGDKDAAYMLVTANLRLVVKIALEFQRVWMQNLLDLIQEGNIGLMQAVKKFDPYKNVKFSYYASFWIKAYILKFIMDNWRLVKIGTTQGQRKLFFKLKKEKQRLIEQGFDPKPKLLSERLGVSEREIVDMDQRLDSWDVSLDAPVKNDSETERIEFISSDSESVEEQVSKKEIELLLHNKIGEFRKKMSPREIEIFELRIFSDNPVTLQEIGDRYGISRERVRQIEKNIIRKIREFFKSEIPDFASYSDSEDTSAE
jgi:RNA polymerase sigma-32 factor